MKNTPSELKSFFFKFVIPTILTFSGMIFVPYLLTNSSSSAKNEGEKIQTFEGRVLYEFYVPPKGEERSYYAIGVQHAADKKLILLNLNDAGQTFSNRSIEAMVSVGNSLKVELPESACMFRPTINGVECNTDYFIHHTSINNEKLPKNPEQIAEDAEN